MRKFIISAVIAAASFAATPSFATGYGHQHSYRPVHYKPVYHKPHYQPQHYISTHTYVKPEVTKTYEKREVYFYEKVKVKGYCKDEVTKKGYQVYRKTIECKAGEPEKTPEPAPAPVEPPK